MIFLITTYDYDHDDHDDDLVHEPDHANQSLLELNIQQRYFHQRHIWDPTKYPDVENI